MMIALKNEMNVDKSNELLTKVDDLCDGVQCSNYRRKKIELAKDKMEFDFDAWALTQQEWPRHIVDQYPDHLGYIYEIQHSYCPVETVESNYIMRELQKLCSIYGEESPECNIPEYPKQKKDLDIV